MKTSIIAEIGENHLGCINLAKRMIEEAAIAGADYVKFQSYRGQDFDDSDPEKEWFFKVELSNEDHFELKEHAKKYSLEFLSSPFSLERAKFLVEDLKLKKIKVASGMMLNFKVLDYLNKANVDEIFLSTGMATLSEIKESLSHLKSVPKINILHCTTQYPCADEDANLKAIVTLKNEFPKNTIGYSDHTIGIDACIAAVVLGAEVLEKHFTLNKKCKEGTDHILSAEPHELREMINEIRRTENLLGKLEKKPTDSEKEITDFVRGRFINNI